jgi:hypothetical protein
MRASAMLSGRALAALLLSILVGSVVAAQSARSLDVAVNDARPLSAALLELEKRLSWVLTYEDPQWTFSGDVQDRSARTGKTYDKPQMIPRGGALSFSIPPAARSATREGRAELVQALLQAYHLTPDHHGEFRMIETEDAIHVVPAHAKNAQGKLEARTSLLDTPIRLVPGTRSALDLTSELAEAVSAGTGKKVSVFFVPTNLFFRTKVTVDDSNEDNSARAALSRILKATGRKLSWRLVYLPDVHQGYALSVHEVKDPSN